METKLKMVATGYRLPYREILASIKFGESVIHALADFKIWRFSTIHQIKNLAKISHDRLTVSLT